MTSIKSQSAKRCRARHLETDSGIALITVLFMLIIMSILGLTMVVSVNSDMMINGYYANSRAAYYAADSGMNISRQYLTNQLQLQVNMNPCLGWGSNATGNCAGDPLSTTAWSTAINNLNSTYYSLSNGNLSVGNASGSWPSSFMVQNSNCTNSLAPAPLSPKITTTNINGAILNTEYMYTYNYVLCSTGAGSSTQRSAIKESGSLSLDIKALDYPPPTFAGYGQFVQNQAPCMGAYLTPGTYTGPTYTNGTWSLGNSGAYIFTNPVSQAQAQIDYYVGSNCTPSTSSTFPGITATFQQGLKLSAAVIQPPTDTISQQWAVLDGSGIGETGTPNNATLNTHLRDINGNAFPSGGTSSGVFLPYSRSNSSSPWTLGLVGTNPGVQGSAGGIYIQGNASILLTPGTDTSGNLTQVYTISQGSTVTTITTNPVANTTTVASGSTTQILTGIPQNLASSPGSAIPGTLVYVNGTITGLSGPGEGVPAIQNNAMVTVVGSGNINVTGDIVYATEPVTRNTADSLLLPQPIPTAFPNSASYGLSSSPAAYQVFGLFTQNGTINLSSPYADHNLETDGSLAAIGASCSNSSCGFTNSGTINTWTNVGGQIQSNQFVCNIATANTYYDQRFSQWSGFFPPWFPSTSTGGCTISAYTTQASCTANGGTWSQNYIPQAPKPIATQQRTSWAWIPAQ
jgi:Tfp pilus assembly protein PilX